MQRDRDGNRDKEGISHDETEDLMLDARREAIIATYKACFDAIVKGHDIEELDSPLFFDEILKELKRTED